MKTNWYLGNIRDKDGQQIYLGDFSWECGWYWSGGYVVGANFFSHFDGCFLDVPDIRGHPLGRFYTPWSTISENAKIISNGWSIWEPLDFFLDNAQYNATQWWRIKDLFKQFYCLRDAAEVFQYGGHCISDGRDHRELDQDMAARINEHLGTIIIPLIRKELNKG